MKLFMFLLVTNTTFQPEVEYYAAKHKVDKNLIYGIIKQESSFNPVATSKAGAQGLMQILPSTHREIENKHDVTPITIHKGKLIIDPGGLETGIIYIKQLIKKKRSVKAALSAYNMGPNSKRTNYRYANKVLKYKRYFDRHQ